MRTILFGFVILMLVGCVPGTAVSPTPTPVPLPPTTDAIWIDAGMMAEDLGISVEEAVRRAQGQDAIGNLNAALEANEKETFAGLWLVHEPAYKVMVAFTENGEATMDNYLNEYPIAAPVDVIEVDYSLAELLTVQTAVANQLQQAGFPVSASVMVQDNVVELYVTDEALFNQTLAENNIELPDNVRVDVVYEPLAQVPANVTAVPDVFMPQLRVASSSYMEALLPGTLVVDAGCLRVQTENGDSYLVIWQPDYFLNDNDGQVEVLDRDGEVVATVGEPIQMGGGEASQFDETQLNEPVPDGCSGPYWFMGQLVR